MIEWIKNNFKDFYIDRGPENGILQGTKYAGSRTHCRACLNTLARMRKPQTILEIGSMNFDSSNAMSEACPESVIMSFDIKQGGYHGRYVPPKYENIKEMYWFPYHSHYDNWKYGGTELDFRPYTNDQLFAMNGNILASCGIRIYDLIFIDGDHSFEGVCRDFLLVSHFANDETLFVVDNVWDTRLWEVRQFFDLLPYDKWDFEEWNDEHPEMVQDTGIFTMRELHESLQT